VPARSGRLGSSPFTAASRESETPLRAAIALRVSPQRTRRPPPLAGAAAAAGALAVVEAVPGAAPGAGIVSVLPAITRASGDRPLAAATALAERPLAVAMPHRVSPGATRCVAPSAGVVGSRTAAASAAPARRTVRSMGMA
jgi:hypothetical protein